MDQRTSRASFQVHVDLEPPVGSRVIRIEPGDQRDLHEVVVPARPGRDAVTLGEAIGARVDELFEEPESAVSPSPESSSVDAAKPAQE